MTSSTQGICAPTDTKKISMRFTGMRPLSSNQRLNRWKEKTPEYHKFERKIDKAMLAWAGDIQKFFVNFDDKKHALACEILIYVPDRDLFVQTGERKGRLSKRRLDVANAEKALVDAVFYNLPIDDYIIIDNRQYQKLSEDGDYHTVLTLKIVDLDKSLT